MPPIPGPSTIVWWILYSIPIYIFVIAPLLGQIFPPRDDDAVGLGETYDFYDDEADADVAKRRLKLDDDTVISLEDGVPLKCAGDDEYRVHLLSTDPLMIYIEGFLRDWEADHLVRASENRYTPSVIYNEKRQTYDPSIRRSDRALLDRDQVVRCIEDRARSFQGWRPHLYIERLWTQRYNTSGHYNYHYDWSDSVPYGGGGRISTFMVYLDDRCTGGGTNFPLMKMPPTASQTNDKWCRFLECGNETETGSGGRQGITFKPIKGNAIYWENLRANGTGYAETWHAAFPVTSGSKIGMNIWSWYQPPRWIRRRREP